MRASTPTLALVLVWPLPGAADEPEDLEPGSVRALEEAERLHIAADSLANRRKVAEAIDTAAHAVELAPAAPDPRWLLGKLYLQIGDCAQAIHHLSEFRRLGRDDKQLKKARKLVGECTGNKKRRGRLDVRVQPEGAAVRILAPWQEPPVAAGHGAVEAKLPAGSYRVQAQLPGYLPLDEPARILPLQTTKVAHTLLVRPASLTVSTVPPGAQVRLDGKPVGESPVTLERVAAGDHEVVAELAGHRVARAGTRARPGQSVRLELRPEPEVAKVHVRTNVPGARVEVDGTDRGPAPCPLELEAGRRQRVRVLAPGWLPGEMELVPEAGKRRRLRVLLKEDPATVARASRERWGLVLVSTGVALAVGGVAALALGYASSDEADAAYARYAGAGAGPAARTAWDDTVALDEQARLETSAGLGLLAAGAGVGLLGAWRWLGAPEPEDETGE